MKEDILERFERNLDRVRHILSVYEERKDQRGRPSVRDADMLRAGVVLLHASLEDLLRSLTEWKLPQAPPEQLKDIPMINMGKVTKFSLDDLARHRGSSVDEVVRRSVLAHLERSNYNNTTEITALLLRIAVDVGPVKRHAAVLDSMIKRRHLIVHRADRNMLTGTGHHAAASISRKTIEQWVDTVQTFGNELLSGL